LVCAFTTSNFNGAAAQAPSPLLDKGQPVDWWSVFKFNTASFPLCGSGVTRVCSFGGDPQPYKQWSQRFAFASKDAKALKDGDGCVGDQTNDPLGATFDQVYNGKLNYVIWNDQFYDDPDIKGCSESCGGPWGHSKGLLAWDGNGEGFVLQVTTPSWPAAGSSGHPRKTDGNTLGCIKDDDVEVSQHFFSLKLTKDDVIKVLNALANASVVTDPKNEQIVKADGPADVKALVEKLGVRLQNTKPMKETLSSGVVLISKPSALHVPPWQMVSAQASNPDRGHAVGNHERCVGERLPHLCPVSRFRDAVHASHGDVAATVAQGDPQPLPQLPDTARIQLATYQEPSTTSGPAGETKRAPWWNDSVPRIPATYGRSGYRSKNNSRLRVWVKASFVYSDGRIATDTASSLVPLTCSTNGLAEISYFMVLRMPSQSVAPLKAFGLRKCPSCTTSIQPPAERLIV